MQKKSVLKICACVTCVLIAIGVSTYMNLQRHEAEQKQQSPLVRSEHESREFQSAESSTQTRFGKITSTKKAGAIEKVASEYLLDIKQQEAELYAADYLDLFSKHWMAVYECEKGRVCMLYIKEHGDGICEVKCYELNGKAEGFLG